MQDNAAALYAEVVRQLEHKQEVQDWAAAYAKMDAKNAAANLTGNDGRYQSCCRNFRVHDSKTACSNSCRDGYSLCGKDDKDYVSVGILKTV